MERGGGVKCAEAFEISEYGQSITKEKLSDLLGF
jgi:hypothetical protein